MTGFNWDLLVPYKYGNVYITLRQLEQIMLPDYHPEYVRRFLAWLHYKNGNVGAGGLSRTDQPTGPTFAASLYVSFHWAGQTYNDGVTAACAVDTVFKDGPDPGDAHDGIAWTQVPIQGSAEAVRWGIHANVGVPGKGESWHLQPVEVDGHASWVKAGCPAPVTGYPIPVEHDPHASTPPVPAPTSGEEIDMYVIAVNRAGWPTPVDLVVSDEGTRWNANAHTSALDQAAGVPRVDGVTKEQALNMLVDRHGIGRHPFGGDYPEYTDAELAAAW